MIHHCDIPYSAIYKQYGYAIGRCTEDNEGRLFVDNGEYENQVNFCPICGFEAKVKIK